MPNVVKYTSNPALEALKIAVREVNAVVTLTGSTSLASITTSTNMPDGVIAYVETTGQPTPADAGANFGTLDSEAAASTVGILVMTGTAARVVDIQIPALGISSASMTAGVVSKKGASSTGVTASGNIAFTVSCTGLDLDAAVATHSFPIIVKYLPAGNTI